MNPSIVFLPPHSALVIAALAIALGIGYLALRSGMGARFPLAKHWQLMVPRAALLCILAILFVNPIRLTEEPGLETPRDAYILLDASKSMRLGQDGRTRWDQAIDWMQEIVTPVGRVAGPTTHVFQFGETLRAVDDPQALTKFGKVFEATASGAKVADQRPAGDDDSQLSTALRELISRFGAEAPGGVFVISDGRVRETEELSAVAAQYARLGVPIHVAPCGESNQQGDVAVVSLIAPASVRKHAQVHTLAIVRSSGFVGERVELELDAVDRTDAMKRIANAPVALQDGLQSIDLTFAALHDDHRLRATIRPLAGEYSSANNSASTDVAIDRTHIRVLYLQGAALRFTNEPTLAPSALRGAVNPLEAVLEADESIACTTLRVANEGFVTASGPLDAFPASREELYAYDALVMHDVPRSAFTDEHCEWVADWIDRRGGGLCVVGGPDAFTSDWARSPLAKVFPVTTSQQKRWQASLTVALRPRLEAPLQPIFRLTADESLNRQLWEALPNLSGAHPGLLVRENIATELAALVSVSDAARETAADRIPGIVAGPYGRGRTLAMAVELIDDGANGFANWGGHRPQYYAEFWQNVVYWLSENSVLGRRSLSATTDKRVYAPGEPIVIRASAHDTSSALRTDHRVTLTIVPGTTAQASNYAPLGWPREIDRTDIDASPLVAWDEALELPARPQPDWDATHELKLAIVDSPAIDPASCELQLEFTTFDGDTQVDSCTLPVQILCDPYEQRNPFPDHALLMTLATQTSGTALTSRESLQAALRDMPVTKSAAQVQRSPGWNRWSVLAALLGLLVSEWCFRRRLGMA